MAQVSQSLMTRFRRWRSGETDLVAMCVRLLSLQGCWQSRSATPEKGWWLARHWWARCTLYTNVVLALIISPVTVYHSWGVDTRNVVEIVAGMFVILSEVGNVWFLLYRQQCFQSLVDSLKSMKVLGRGHLDCPEEVWEEGRWLRQIPMRLYLLSVPVLACVVLIAIPRQAVMHREFLINFWFPFDVKSTPIFEIFLLIMMSLVAFGLHAIMVVNNMILAMLADTASQLKLLNHNIKNIFTKRTSIETSPEAEVLNINSVEDEDSGQSNSIPDIDFERVNASSACDVSHEKTGEQLSEARRRAWVSLASKLRKSIASQKPGSMNIETEERLKHCVLHHQATTSFVDEFEATFSVMLLSQFVCMVCPSILAIVTVLFVEEIDEKTMFFIAMVFALYGYQGLVCFLAEKVSEDSEAVREAVYDCDWFNQSESFKRSMRIIMSRSNQPLVVRVAGFIPITMETFHSVLKLTYSYYMSLRVTLDLSK